MIVTVSQIDAFVRFSRGWSYDPDKDMRLALGEKIPSSPKMSLGEQFHDALLLDHYTEKMERVRGLIEVERKSLGRFTPEVPFFMDVTVGHTKVTIKGRIDALIGRAGMEIKTTSSNLPASRYMDSYQWRLYCSALDLSWMQYKIYEVDDEQKEDGFSFKLVSDFRVYPYPLMRSDIKDVVTEFLMFVNESKEEKCNG